MLHLKPLTDSDADSEVLALYGRVRDCFKLDTTPLFFQYMGNFPNFLEFILKSVEKNLSNPNFINLQEDCARTCLELFSTCYSPSATAIQIVDDITTNTQSKEFIRVKLKNLHITNAAIALLFVSFREAIKGWAVETKLLQSKFEDVRHEQVTVSIEREVELSMVTTSEALQQSKYTQQFNYYKFMAVVQSEVEDSQKNNSHLYARLALEEYLVAHQSEVSVDLSYRILAQYAYEYKHFDELVYLLSVSFPTIAASRVIVTSIGKILSDGITSPSSALSSS